MDKSGSKLSWIVQGKWGVGRIPFQTNFVLRVRKVRYKVDKVVN